MERRKSNPGWDLNKMLILLIVVLAVILVAVICAAVGTHGQDATVPTTTTGTPGTVDPSHSQPPEQTTVSAGLTVQPKFDTEKPTIADKVSFTGTSDPNQDVQVNGKSIQRGADGSFTYEAVLSLGENEITFTHKGETVTFSVERRYVVETYAPAQGQSYNSGATVYFTVSARKGSQVTVQLNGQQIQLKADANQLGSEVAEGFVLYTGSYKLPNTNTSDLDLGVVTFTAVCDGVTEEYRSGTITCLKTGDILASDPGVTPSYGDYINVGSGYIAEVVGYTAETFDGDTNDDYSHPTNSYLPKGTVDYCSTRLVQNGSLKYVQLRCGRKIYVEKKNTPSSTKTKITDCYAGKLPDHNEIGFVSMTQSGNHTVLTLDCLWKAPFYFDVLPQTYSNPDGGSGRSYEIVSFTATHIDITFCYATKFTGTVQIPADNPIFRSAELIQNQSDCTLRLHLKKTGGFYGWDCYYNAQDQLCFQFLNPAKVTAADNAYGADLTGVTVMIDVGHGGVDGGATGTDAAGTRWSESGRNMDLAYALRSELESIGATVVFNREGVVTLTVDERIQILKNAAPDFCIAIHHNSIAGHPDINGFGAYYYDPFSQLAAKFIYQRTQASGAYRSSLLMWHNYYVSRQTACPVVLTENGYMTNLEDLNGTLDKGIITKKAQAMAQGIADYFLEINR